MRKNVQRRAVSTDDAWICIAFYLDSGFAQEFAADRTAEFGDTFEYRVVEFEQTCTCTECCRLRNGPTAKLPVFMLE